MFILTSLLLHLHLDVTSRLIGPRPAVRPDQSEPPSISMLTTFIELASGLTTMARTDPALQAFLQPLKNDIERLYSLSSRLSLTYRDLAAGSSELFSPTATTRLPTGREAGRYLAVYLGLHYLRVAFIELLGEEQVGKHSHVRRTLEKAWPIEDRLRRDQATSLFAWIGDCIAEVIHDDLANSKVDAPSEVAMGISFCFPIKYHILSLSLSPPPTIGHVIVY